MIDLSSAVKVKYGIQQPAISKQMQALEENLGCTLFTRGETFTLTPQGRLLYVFLRSFYPALHRLLSRIRNFATPVLRVAASDFILRPILGSADAAKRRQCLTLD